jgi:hypothetical protein
MDKVEQGDLVGDDYARWQQSGFLNNSIKIFLNTLLLLNIQYHYYLDCHMTEHLLE